MRTIQYQQDVLKDLSTYMGDVEECKELITSWHQFWLRQDIRVGQNGVDPYNDSVPGVPYVCMKVPTGGGKTYIACSALARVFEHMAQNRPKFVIWLVPSDAILTQTYKALNDPSHEYRRKINLDFSGKVNVYNKEDLLTAHNFDPDTVHENLSICVFSYASLRINSKNADVRKVYQENGNLKRFADWFQNKELLLADTPDTALIQVLRQLTPLVIVDESHNAGSKLSVEMLTRLNPHFILALTATPLKGTNILSYVNPRDLKKENMVKLPVVVYNRNDRHTVIRDAIQLQRTLEKAAEQERERTGKYIRPIVLFQAQPNIKGKENDTYNKIKSMLLEADIPAAHIAIKTSQLDEIRNIDLLSESCPIRFIITVNALKEGWDCPFAYVLASLANKTSRVDVEQILGRILRQPYQAKLGVQLLNNSFVLTCSNNFRQVLDNIVIGLNKAGFSRRDYKIGSEEPVQPDKPEDRQTGLNDLTMNPPAPYEEPEEAETPVEPDDFSDVHTDELKAALGGGEGASDAQDALAAMLAAAQAQSDQYEQESNQDDHGYETGEKGAMKNQIEIDPQFCEEALALRLPQFFYKTAPNFFGDGRVKLEDEHLLKGFSLAGADANINFDLSTGELYNVDLKATGEAVPQYIKADMAQIQSMKEILARIPSEKRREFCILNICKQINKSNHYTAVDVNDYVRRIIAHMTEDELAAIEVAQFTYATKIKEHIKKLEEAYQEEQFYKWIDSNKIFCEGGYAFPEVITPLEMIDSIPHSLYTAEKNDMNDFERKVLDMIAALPNIKWWHRVIDTDKKKGFRINGFINHYPDFIVKFKSGIIAMIEAKGDHLGNDISKKKLELGRQWQYLAGQQYRYFMVFGANALPGKGSYTLDEIVGVLKEL